MNEDTFGTWLFVVGTVALLSGCFWLSPVLGLFAIGFVAMLFSYCLYRE